MLFRTVLGLSILLGLVYGGYEFLLIVLGISILLGSVYGSYKIRWKEEIIKTALETPEGRQALAEAMVGAEKNKR